LSDGKSPHLAERWSLPAVDGPIVGVRRDTRARDAETARASEAARKAEMDRAYQAGLKAARTEQQGHTDALAARVTRLDEILNQLCRPLPELEAEVEQQLVLLALAVGKQLARRELKADPGQITALIREAVGRLPAAARDVRVHLHPEDASAIAERLASAGQERAWSVVEDPTLSRGGCLVRSENSQIDARLESRVNAIVSSMLGEERASARLNEAAEPDPEAADPGEAAAP
jgi:flagellar assembly protein FliH